MAHTQYLALLRGINVGGKNIIRMAQLKECFEDMGFSDVATYIQSGNVVFNAPKTNAAKLTSSIERALSRAFCYESRVVMISHTHLKTVVDRAPRGFGTEPERYRYDVVFLKKQLSAREAVESVPVKEGVDGVFAGKDVLYFTRLISKASQSKLSRLIQLPIYQSMTIRNWNTTTKLLALMLGKT
jgi:uncharacterized protein (DUF1697 family)